MTKRIRRAQLVAQSVAVCCPWCGEPQPSPKEGSEFWIPEDFATCKSGKHACVACDAMMLIGMYPKVQFRDY